MEQMKKIDKIPLGILKDEEFFQIGDQVMVAIESNNAEALKLRGVFNLFGASLALARTKKKPQRVHPLSPTINELVEQIDYCVMSLMDINRGHKRSVPALQKVSAAITVPFIEDALGSFYKQNSFVKSEWLKAFFDEIDKNSPLSLALTAMSMKPMLDDLRTDYTELVDKRNQRTREKLPPAEETNLTQVQNSKRMLRNLFIAIETNAMLETELNYEPLIININSIISELMRIVNMRRNAQDAIVVEAKSTTAPEAIKPSEAATVNQESPIKPSL